MLARHPLDSMTFLALSSIVTPLNPGRPYIQNLHLKKSLIVSFVLSIVDDVDCVACMVQRMLREQLVFVSILDRGMWSLNMMSSDASNAEEAGSATSFGFPSETEFSRS